MASPTSLAFVLRGWPERPGDGARSGPVMCFRSISTPPDHRMFPFRDRLSVGRVCQSKAATRASSKSSESDRTRPSTLPRNARPLAAVI